MPAVRALALVIGLLLVLSAPGAHADEREDAKQSFAEGQAADKRGDWSAAIEHYLRAYDLVPHPFALYNIAADYEHLGKLREAARYYTLYLAAPESTDRPRVRKLLEELRVRPARLTVRSQPEGARLFIDGQVVGATPYIGKVKGGTHRVAADKDNHRDEKTINIEFGEPVEVQLIVGVNTGTLYVNAYPPGALVTIDGTVAGTSPVQVPLPVGTHRVQIAQEGFSPLDTTAVVTTGMINEIRPRLTTALGSLPVDSSTPPVIKVNYMVGVTAGLDLSDVGPAYAFEFGLRFTKLEMAFAVGKVRDLSSLELQVRYAITAGRLAPVVGAGYSYLGSSAGAGYEALAGVRYELVSNARAGVGLLTYVAARWSVGDPANEDPLKQESFAVFPLNVTLQAYYR
ncbi:MAG: PEGA domain-containing protein [Deltaproteobacteria bacterium]|nr:PEGA domain-containing protein [Deltaproteobacteria bacterium]